MDSWAQGPGNDPDQIYADGERAGRAWAIDRLRDRTAYERWRYLAANEAARTDWSANMLAADFLASEGEATP